MGATAVLLEQHIVRIRGNAGILNIESLVNSVSPMFQVCKQGVPFTVSFDLSRASGIYATGLATLTALGVYLRRHEFIRGGQIIRPSRPEVDAYINRMKLYQHLGVDLDYQWTERDSTGRFCELVEIQDIADVNRVSNELAHIIYHQHGTIARESAFAINYVLSELIENVFHHAQSPVNAIVCAQTYPQLRNIELAIVDCGIGVLRSLQNNPKYSGSLSNSNHAIHRAVQRKVTGNPDYNAGEGLFFTTELVKLNGGDMVIYSGDGIYKITKGIEKKERMFYNRAIAEWPGTIAAMRISLENPLDFTAIFNQHAPPDNDFILMDE